MAAVSQPVIRQFHVVANRAIADGVCELTLGPTDGQPVFDYQAGQFVMLQLLNADGTVWAKAAYSLAGAPDESRDFIVLAVKVRGRPVAGVERRARTPRPGCIAACSHL